MTLIISQEVAIAIVSTAAGMVDEGADEDTAMLAVYSGSAPASIQDTISTSSGLLMRVNLNSTAFGQPARIGDSVEALAFSIPQFESEGEGTASFFRIYNRDGTALFQGDVSDDPVDGAALTLNQVELTVGAVVNVERLVIGIQIA